MKLLLLLLTIHFDFICTTYQHYHYDDDDQLITKVSRAPLHDVEFEPVVNLVSKKEIVSSSNINCEDFAKYAMNCTLDSAFIYNSSRKSPPMPAKLFDWCAAIRYLTNCAVDWNSECKDVTESHFNEESIKGHMHVVNNICDDEWFLTHYDDLPSCIDKASNAWESCYIDFKSVVDFQKNVSQEWTHFETHFELCCARTRFRRCTLDAVFLEPISKCTHAHALTLQKFSVIVSAGDVYQDCDRNIMFENCPGGDPRPSTTVLTKLMNAQPDMTIIVSGTSKLKYSVWVYAYCMHMFLVRLLKLCL